MQSPTNPPLPSLADEPWLRRPETQAVFRALAEAGHDARAVGGVVRNALIGRPVADVDIATPATPSEVVAAAAAAGLETVPTGIAHGTVTVIAAGMPFEVTTLRRDVTTDGRRATVAFTDDWRQDAERRDFTMNALYCSADGTVHDPVVGWPDLEARRVRFIGDADRRIAEDYLRILRFFRFHAELGEGPADEPALAAVIRGRHGLARLSAERVRAEMLRLLVARRVVEAVVDMGGCGLLPGLLGAAPRPGVLAAIVAVEATLGLAADPVLRLSALGLAVEDDAAPLAGRWRLSGDERGRLTVVDHRLAERVVGLDAAGRRRTLYRVGTARWRQASVALAALAPERTEEARDLVAFSRAWSRPVMPLRGADLLRLGILPGPRVGRLLADLEAWWVEHDFPDEAAVRHRLGEIVQGSASQ